VLAAQSKQTLDGTISAHFCSIAAAVARSHFRFRPASGPSGSSSTVLSGAIENPTSAVPISSAGPVAAPSATERTSAPLPSRALQESQIERNEYQDNADVCYQPFREVVPEEEDVHADHDGDQREHVKHYDCVSHRYVLYRRRKRQQRHWLRGRYEPTQQAITISPPGRRSRLGILPTHQPRRHERTVADECFVPHDVADRTIELAAKQRLDIRVAVRFARVLRARQSCSGSIYGWFAGSPAWRSSLAIE
jgi:hypothetical protein